MNIPALHGFIDASIDEAVLRTGVPLTCRAGCFHCCREAAYASREEVLHAIDGLSPEAREVVTARTRAWLDGFLAAGVQDAVVPDAHSYRALRLWCPLLDQATGQCGVYDRRPMECRWFMTQGPAEGCADDEKRKHQVFLEVPGIVDLALRRELFSLPIGGAVIRDHIGLLLAEALLGYAGQSRARIVIKRTGEQDFEVESERTP